ncbi:MAG: hypothetical protein LUH03_10040 [Oscillospiraceae bacterium]|nr:hypothetical protein [Oscillospiraceae bacterium]
MAKTNSGLLAYAKAQVGLPYWYGCYGQTASAGLYDTKSKQYPSYYTATDFKSQYGKRVHDCVGLIKGYLWSSSTTATPVYKSTQDKSAAGMYKAASTKGKIATLPKTAGLLVFKGSTTTAIHHVGVYDGGSYVYEAKGHAYGVTKTKFKASDWNYWAQCPYTTDDTSETETVTTTTTTTTVAVKTATDNARSYLKTLAGTYKAAGNLNVRNGAGTGKSIMVTIPSGTKVECYGYYTTVSSVKWLYVQFTYKNTQYTGFCSSNWLTKL